MATQTPTMPSGSSNEGTPFPRSPDTEPARPAASGPATLDRVVHGAHEAVDRVARRAAPALDTLSTAASDVNAWRDEWVTTCRNEVRAHPLAAVALGVLAGLLVGRLISR
ncbi:hypothetical protein [Caldimonas sp. KR1-144]|uniref:hypothetical protein n=1 Tax=Caldimonas sp. KR1-144 TaxID=3400911 RepID=UPI003C0587DD